MSVINHLKETPLRLFISSLKGGSLWNFQQPFCRKTSKQIEGGTHWGKIIEKKSRSAETKLKDPFSLARYCMLRREKKRKSFLVRFARPNGSI